jgi:hypothetical protein
MFFEDHLKSIPFDKETGKRISTVLLVNDHKSELLVSQTERLNNIIPGKGCLRCGKVKDDLHLTFE